MDAGDNVIINNNGDMYVDNGFISIDMEIYALKFVIHALVKGRILFV